MPFRTDADYDHLLTYAEGMTVTSINVEELKELIELAKGNYVQMLLNMNALSLIGTEDHRALSVNRAHDIALDMLRVIRDIYERSTGETVLTSCQVSLDHLRTMIERIERERDE